MSTDESATLRLKALELYAEHLAARAIVVADIDRIRVRRD